MSYVDRYRHSYSARGIHIIELVLHLTLPIGLFQLPKLSSFPLSYSQQHARPARPIIISFVDGATAVALSDTACVIGTD